MRNCYRGLFPALVVVAALLCSGCHPQKTMRVFLIGDSTMADKPLADNPERGWGQMFPLFFNSAVQIENFAKNGRSTKSFIAEGRWKTIYDTLRPGDYVLIQFGHNDEKKQDTTRYTEPHTSYKQNLSRFVNEAREKGAVPILLTSIARRKFDENNRLVRTHGAYPDVVREVATASRVPLIDMEKKSEHLFSELGPEGTKKIFLWIPPGEYGSLPQGKEDDTHFQVNGAMRLARIVAEEIKALDLPLSRYLKKEY